MQDTVDDREFFQRLVKAFGFNNPRQLLRMRNSFRVLKGIQKGNSDQPVTAGKAQEMMLALFWLENLNDKPPAERGQLRFETLQDVADPSPDSTEARKFRKLFQEVFGGTALGEGGTALQEFIAFVSRFVLPYYDGSEPSPTAPERVSDLRQVPKPPPVG